MVKRWLLCFWTSLSLLEMWIKCPREQWMDPGFTLCCGQWITAVSYCYFCWFLGQIIQLIKKEKNKTPWLAAATNQLQQVSVKLHLQTFFFSDLKPCLKINWLRSCLNFPSCDPFSNKLLLHDHMLMSVMCHFTGIEQKQAAAGRATRRPPSR